MDGQVNSVNGTFSFVRGVTRLLVVASDGGGWDHVSVSTASRCPTWNEMAWVKQQFFREDECVMELHPAKADYINDHPFCLHLWRPQTADEIAAVRAEWCEAGEEWPYGDLHPAGEIPLPPKVFVGVGVRGTA